MEKEIKEILILGSLLGIIMIISFFVMLDHNRNIKNQDTNNIETNNNNEGLVTNLSGTDDIIIEETPLIEEDPTPESVTGLIIGLDASGGLTDVLMTVRLNTQTNELAFISVPRDLEIDYGTEPFKSMRLDFNEKVKNGEIDAKLHQRSYSKVNAIFYDTGKTSAGLNYTKDVVEKIIGMDIDYIGVIDVYGFKDIIDIIGGIDFNVPQDMYYNDPKQDLHIDLKEGFQHLDGEHAMQLVRFRHYKLGDLQRIQVQQDFIIAVYQKILATKDFDTLSDIIKSAYNIVDTDFGIIVALKYASYVFNLQLDNLFNDEHMITIPSWGELVEYEQDGVVKSSWHQYWDMDKAHEAVNSLLQP